MNDFDADRILEQMFAQAEAQFGDAVKAHWFYGDDRCPACRKEIDFMEEGEDANLLSMNGFMYRERGVLIGYMLCGSCAKSIHEEAARNPGIETERHAIIEMHLIEGYQRYLRSLDA